MKPIAPKPFTTPKTKPTYKFKKAMPSPNRRKDPIQKGLEFFFGDKPTGKSRAPKPRAVRPSNSKPAPMPTMMPKYPRGVKPAPMPKVEGNYGKPRSERTLPKKMGPKSKQNPSLNRKTPSTATPKLRAKKKY